MDCLAPPLAPLAHDARDGTTWCRAHRISPQLFQGASPHTRRMRYRDTGRSLQKGFFGVVNRYRFTRERRERLLTLIECGRNVTDAAAATGISRQSVAEWAARGRQQPDTEPGEFAARFDALLAGRDALRQEDDAEDALAKLEARDAEDPFCRLPGDAFG